MSDETKNPDPIASSCSYCGLENKEGLRSCPGCGTPLAKEQPSADHLPKSKLLAVLLALALGSPGLLYLSFGNFLGMCLILSPLMLIAMALKATLWMAIAGRIACAIRAFYAIEAGNRAPSAEAQELLQEAARLENVDRAQALAKYAEIVSLFPDTTASREATRNIRILSQHQV
jgi:hypothetical protein